MEHFRSTGTSGGLIHTRTGSAYVKARVSEMLRLVGIADTAVERTGRLREQDITALRTKIGEVVSDAWLRSQAEADSTRRFDAVTEDSLPELADRAFSDVLRARFPEETVRPALNSRWG